MTRTADVAIIGGGVIGLTTAYELLRAGSSVIVIERGEPGREASWAGAGIIPPGNPRFAVSADDRLRAESAERFPSLAAELTELTGIETGYWRCGGYEHLVAEDASLIENWRRERIEFDKRQSNVAASYFFPGMAQIRNPWHLRALTSAVTKLGGSIHTRTTVVGWDRDEDRILAAKLPQDSVAADEYLVCGGAWTEGLLAPFGVRLGVKPVRGQIVLYRIDQGGPQRIHIWDHRYLVPRGDGLILAGSTEEDVGFDSNATPAGVAELREFAESQWPALAKASLETTWAGLRPGSPEGRPFLGRVPGIRNLSVAAGHFRAGIQLSPGTGRAMAELLTGRDPFIPLDPFRIGRPIGLPIRPTFRS